MFVGHFALGFAAKKIAPKTSLGTLLLSVGFVDVLFPFFLLLGWEHVRIVPGITRVMPFDLYDMPYTHSLLMGVAWAAVFGGVYYGLRRYARGAWVVAAGVLSHWVLDFLSHRPDMPLGLAADSPKYGLGLWNSLAGTLIVESALWVSGVAIYVQATRAKDAVGKWSLIAFVGAFSLMYVANVFGPPPPSAEAFGWSGFVILALFAWPYWIDRHRVAV